MSSPRPAETVVEDPLAVIQKPSRVWPQEVCPELECFIAHEHAWGRETGTWQRQVSWELKAALVEAFPETGVLEHPSIALLAVCPDIYNDKLVVAVDNGKQHNGVGALKIRKRGAIVDQSKKWEFCYTITLKDKHHE